METKIKTSEDNNSVTLIDHGLFPSLTADYFNASYWQSLDAITGSAQGRGTTWFFKYDTNDFVLRHYHRGGMIGRVLNDEYLYFGKESTRAFQEFQLLHHMHELNLPVPQPAAAQVIKSGLIYRADIITTRIQNATSVVEHLKEGVLDHFLWKSIGETVRRFHDLGIYHHDLNANNLLIDNERKVWVIDFDRGRIENNKRTHATWKQNNLARLQRSLLKEQKRHPTLHWAPENWNFLLQGYSKTS